MPIYAYKCQACGHQFDKIQRISDAALTDCPDCNQPELKKQITAAAFKLTGTGWYETDFKNNNKKDSDQAKSSDNTSSKTNTESKSDSGSKSSESKSDNKSTAKKDAA